LEIICGSKLMISVKLGFISTSFISRSISW